MTSLLSRKIADMKRKFKKRRETLAKRLKKLQGSWSREERRRRGQMTSRRIMRARLIGSLWGKEGEELSELNRIAYFHKKSTEIGLVMLREAVELRNKEDLLAQHKKSDTQILADWAKARDAMIQERRNQGVRKRRAVSEVSASLTLWSPTTSKNRGKQEKEPGALGGKMEDLASIFEDLMISPKRNWRGKWPRAKTYWRKRNPPGF